MKTRLLIIIVAITIGVIVTSTVGTMEYQSTYNQNCNSDGGKIVGFLRCIYINEDFDVPKTASDCRKIFGKGTTEMYDCLEKLEENANVPPPINQSAERDSAWVIDAKDELYSLGCDKSILEYLYRSSNLLDDDFDGNYFQNFIGLPDGVSKEKFEECADFIYEKRTSLISSELDNLNPTERDDKLVTFQDKSLDYWKSLDFDQLREYNSKSDRDEFYYALGELLAKEYFLGKLVELNLVNVNDDLTIHTGFANQPDPPIIDFNTVVNATDGFSYVMHTSVQGNRLGEYFKMAQLVFEPHILSAISENKPAPFTNKFGESTTIYIVTEEGDDKLSLHEIIIDFDQTNNITFVNNSLNSVRIQEVGENKIDEIPKDSWRTNAIVPGESLTMQFNSTGFYEFNVKKITDFLPGYLEHHTEGEIVVFTENMTDYTFADGLLMGSTFILDAPRPEIPWQSIGAGNSRGLEIGIVDSVIEAFPNAYEYYLTKAKSLIPFDVPITIEFSGPIRLD